MNFFQISFSVKICYTTYPYCGEGLSTPRVKSDSEQNSITNSTDIYLLTNQTISTISDWLLSCTESDGA